MKADIGSTWNYFGRGWDGGSLALEVPVPVRHGCTLSGFSMAVPWAFMNDHGTAMVLPMASI